MSDISVSSCVTTHSHELEEIAGQGCCFILFRDLQQAKNFVPFKFSEHAANVYPFANVVGIEMNAFPCIVFLKI